MVRKAQKRRSGAGDLGGRSGGGGWGGDYDPKRRRTLLGSAAPGGFGAAAQIAEEERQRSSFSSPSSESDNGAKNGGSPPHHPVKNGVPESDRTFFEQLARARVSTDPIPFQAGDWVEFSENVESVQLERDKWVKHVRKVPHIPTAYVWARAVISTPPVPHIFLVQLV